MDIDQLLNERVLELFGPETLELNEEYQADIALQRIHTLPPLQIDTKEQLKAQAKYRREAAARLTKYSLEPTFQMPDTIRAKPINNAEPREDEPTTPEAVTITVREESQPKISNTKRRKEQYKETRKRIRQQRKEEKTTQRLHHSK